MRVMGKTNKLIILFLAALGLVLPISILISLPGDMGAYQWLGGSPAALSALALGLGFCLTYTAVVAVPTYIAIKRMSQNPLKVLLLWSLVILFGYVTIASGYDWAPLPRNILWYETWLFPSSYLPWLATYAVICSGYAVCIYRVSKSAIGR